MERVSKFFLSSLLVLAGTAQAHHSYNAFFQIDERIWLEGVVDRFLAQNPHGYIVFNVVDGAGETEQWRAEMPGWVGLSRGRGWTADDLKPGDPITIVGAPASTGDETLIRADDIVMPDGWTRHLFNDPTTGRRRDPTLLVSMISPNPVRFTEEGEHIGLEAERWDTVRTIYMDGRAPPPATPHSINGYSVGRFDADTLVIETTHITAGWNLTGGGPPHSDALEVTERYRVTEDGRLEVTYTVEDPATFTGPVSWQRYNRPADLQVLNSYNCQPSPGSGYSWEND